MKGMLRSFDLAHDGGREGTPLDNLVIDIGDVHHKLDVVIEVVAENAHDDVLAQVRSTRECRARSPNLACPM